MKSSTVVKALNTSIDLHNVKVKAQLTRPGMSCGEGRAERKSSPYKQSRIRRHCLVDWTRTRDLGIQRSAVGRRGRMNGLKLQPIISGKSTDGVFKSPLNLIYTCYPQT